MKHPGGIMFSRPLSSRAVLATVSIGAAILVLSVLVPFTRAQAPSDDIEWSEMMPLASKSLLLDVTEAGDRVFVVGDRGHILLSDDNGTTWTQAAVPTRSMLNAVAAVDADHAWAVGHDSVIVHTSDGGKTWVRQHWDPEAACPLFDVWFENANHGLAVGAYAYIVETHDGGKTWEQRDVDEEERHWYSIAEAPDGTLYVAAEMGVVFKSEDKGRNWEVLSTPYGGTYFGAETLKDGTLLIFGLRGRVYRSADGGQTWKQIHVDTTSGLQTGLQLRDGTVVIAGLSGAVLLSSDGGETFLTANRSDRLGISSLIELESDGVLLAGEEGIHRVDSLQ